jgi:hypothetical protein
MIQVFKKAKAIKVDKLAYYENKNKTSNKKLTGFSGREALYF